ncbi:MULTISPECIES: alpha/beta hydrolase family protein [unclassified Microbacterium]|uniref:alpha/beta hydrolase family protein n=1 Tax=unclassified Microbacterium TaxID=2609290 RepID=UPI0034418755
MQTKIRERIVRAVAVVVVVAAALVGTAAVGNDYRFVQEAVTIPGPEGELAGVLALPVDGEARGLVVMVHGDGPVDATQGGLYAPWFEGAADAGFATLSWSKPGIAGSAGDWLEQSMEDRAAEVSAAIDWARTRAEIPTGTIVLWGASQAGWVLPKVTRDRDDIAGVVAVGTTIDWLRQGRFHLLAELDHAGATDEERTSALEESDRTRDLLDRGASYQEYLGTTTSAAPMSEARWGFVQRNFDSDATADLAASAPRSIPTLLMVGAHDRHVDVDETEQTYRAILGSAVSVIRVDGAHSLARPVMEESDVVGLLTATFWPRALFSPEVVDGYATFLARIPPSS